MAKGQKRSNRETRKPKQPKAAPPVSASGFAALAQSPGKPGRK